VATIGFLTLSNSHALQTVTPCVYVQRMPMAFPRPVPGAGRVEPALRALEWPVSTPVRMMSGPSDAEFGECGPLFLV
jgi:hypothetical protein